MKTLRVPVIGPYNTRVSAVNAADTSSGYVGVGIVGLMIVGKVSASVGKDARYVNCFAETVSDPITGKALKYCVKRPGFGTSNTPSSGKKGYAIQIWTGNNSAVISAFDSPSTIYSGTTSLGSLTGKCTSINETFLSSTATLAFTSDDNTAWYYDTGVGTTTKITSANFVGNNGKTITGPFAFIDGFACIMCTDGTVGVSDVNSLTAWTASSVITASAYPGKGIAVVRNRDKVLALKTDSVEVFYNAGLSPCPLAKATSLTQKVGCVSADAIATIADTVFWAGSTPQGGLSIFKYDGGLTRISTPEIDALLILAGATNITLTSIRFYGRSFVLAICGTNSTYAYCVEENFWYEWSSTTPLWYKCAAVSLLGTMVNYAVSNVSTSGKVYIMNHASLAFTDDGTTYTARAQLPNMDLGTQAAKMWRSVGFIADTEASTSTLTLSYTDDDYATYTTFGSVDLSTSGNKLTLYRLGSSRKRGWVLTHAANTPMRIEALEINVDVGNN